MVKYPYSEGDRYNAQIAVVGEGPGRLEILKNRPFVGPSGQELNFQLQCAGVSRRDLYITNLYKTEAALNVSKISKEEKESWNLLLLEELAEMPNLKVIVPLGSHALNALLGVTNITARRGFMHSIVNGRLAGKRVMPMLHPAYILRAYKMHSISVFDWKKVKAELEGKTNPIKFTLLSEPSFEQAMDELQRMVREKNPVASDIEGMRRITALSFADRNDWSMCIPLEKMNGESYWSDHEEVELTRLMSQLYNTCDIIGHNFLYDAYHLAHHGYFEAKKQRWDKLKFDTLSAHIAAGFGDLPHSLEFLASVYTDLPYWKEDAKDWKLSHKDRNEEGMRLFWRYSALDSLATYQVYEQLDSELDETGTRHVYERFYRDLTPHLLQISMRGIKVDYTTRKALRSKYVYELSKAESRLPLINGETLNVKSPKQKKDFFAYYGYTVDSTDAKSLRKLKKKIQEPTVLKDIETIQKVTLLRDMISRYLVQPLGHDERYHFSLKPTTKTGRLASSKDCFGYGFNAQNITMDIREMFIPDDGHTLIYADLKNAENRIVADLARCMQMIDMFRSGVDFHSLNAANIFKLDPIDFVVRYESGDKEINKVRKKGKMFSHAFNYDVGKNTLAEQAGISPAEAERVLKLVAEAYPEIERWKKAITAQLKKTSTLTNPFGRKRFFFDRFGPDMIHEGLAQIPQSTVPDIINLALIEINKKYTVLNQVHDAILVQVPDDEVEEAKKFIEQAMLIPIQEQSKANAKTGWPILTLEIPVDFEIGKDWKNVK